MGLRVGGVHPPVASARLRSTKLDSNSRNLALSPANDSDSEDNDTDQDVSHIPDAQQTSRLVDALAAATVDQHRAVIAPGSLLSSHPDPTPHPPPHSTTRSLAADIAHVWFHASTSSTQSLQPLRKWLRRVPLVAIPEDSLLTVLRTGNVLDTIPATTAASIPPISLPTSHSTLIDSFLLSHRNYYDHGCNDTESLPLTLIYNSSGPLSLLGWDVVASQTSHWMLPVLSDAIRVYKQSSMNLETAVGSSRNFIHAYLTNWRITLATAWSLMRLLLILDDGCSPDEQDQWFEPNQPKRLCLYPICRRKLTEAEFELFMVLRSASTLRHVTSVHLCTDLCFSNDTPPTSLVSTLIVKISRYIVGGDPGSWFPYSKMKSGGWLEATAARGSCFSLSAYLDDIPSKRDDILTSSKRSASMLTCLCNTTILNLFASINSRARYAAFWTLFYSRRTLALVFLTFCAKRALLSRISTVLGPVNGNKSTGIQKDMLINENVPWTKKVTNLIRPANIAFLAWKIVPTDNSSNSKPNNNNTRDDADKVVSIVPTSTSSDPGIDWSRISLPKWPTCTVNAAKRGTFNAFLDSAIFLPRIFSALDGGTLSFWRLGESLPPNM